MLSDSGRVPPKVMAEAYDTDDYRFLPGKLGSAMAEARRAVQAIIRELLEKGLD